MAELHLWKPIGRQLRICEKRLPESGRAEVAVDRSLTATTTGSTATIERRDLDAIGGVHCPVADEGYVRQGGVWVGAILGR